MSGSLSELGLFSVASSPLPLWKSISSQITGAPLALQAGRHPSAVQGRTSSGCYRPIACGRKKTKLKENPGFIAPTEIYKKLTTNCCCLDSLKQVACICSMHSFLLWKFSFLSSRWPVSRGFVFHTPFSFSLCFAMPAAHSKRSINGVLFFLFFHLNLFWVYLLSPCFCSHIFLPAFLPSPGHLHSLHQSDSFPQSPSPSCPVWLFLHSLSFDLNPNLKFSFFPSFPQSFFLSSLPLLWSLPLFFQCPFVQMLLILGLAHYITWEVLKTSQWPHWTGDELTEGLWEWSLSRNVSKKIPSWFPCISQVENRCLAFWLNIFVVQSQLYIAMAISSWLNWCFHFSFSGKHFPCVSSQCGSCDLCSSSRS